MNQKVTRTSDEHDVEVLSWLLYACELQIMRRGSSSNKYLGHSCAERHKIHQYNALFGPLKCLLLDMLMPPSFLLVIKKSTSACHVPRPLYEAKHRALKLDRGATARATSGAACAGNGSSRWPGIVARHRQAAEGLGEVDVAVLLM